MKKQNGNTSTAQKTGAILVALGLAVSAAGSALLPENSLAESTGAKIIKVTSEMLDASKKPSVEKMREAKKRAKSLDDFDFAAGLDAGIIYVVPDKWYCLSDNDKEYLEEMGKDWKITYESFEDYKKEFIDFWGRQYNIRNYNEFLNFAKKNDLSIEEAIRGVSVKFNRNVYPWESVELSYLADGSVKVSPNALVYLINEFENLTYEQIQKYIVEKYENDLDFDSIPAVINHTDKTSFNYPGGIEFRILDDGTVIKIAKDGSTKTYTPGIGATLHVYEYNGKGLLVWESKIDSKDSTLGGVYRMITPRGEMYEKIFLNEIDKDCNHLNDWAVAIRVGDEIISYYDTYGYNCYCANDGLNDYNNIGEGIRYHGPEKAHWIYFPRVLESGKISLSNNHPLDDGLALSSRLFIGSSDAARFYGEVKQEGERTVLVWNDGKKEYLTTNYFAPFYGLPDLDVEEIKYPNGRSLKIEKNGITISQDGELLGTINADMDDYRSQFLWEKDFGEILAILKNGEGLVISEGKEYSIYGTNSKIKKSGTYEGGSLVDISLSNEEIGYKNGVFEIITGVEKEKEAKHLPMRDYISRQEAYQNSLNVKLKTLKRPGRF